MAAWIWQDGRHYVYIFFFSKGCPAIQNRKSYTIRAPLSGGLEFDPLFDKALVAEWAAREVVRHCR